MDDFCLLFVSLLTGVRFKLIFSNNFPISRHFSAMDTFSLLFNLVYFFATFIICGNFFIFWHFCYYFYYYYKLNFNYYHFILRSPARQCFTTVLESATSSSCYYVTPHLTKIVFVAKVRLDLYWSKTLL